MNFSKKSSLNFSYLLDSGRNLTFDQSQGAYSVYAIVWVEVMIYGENGMLVLKSNNLH